MNRHPAAQALRKPSAHRDNLTGLDKTNALLEDILDKQREVWRWNVGPYVLKRVVINTTTAILPHGEQVLARFTNPVDLGGSLLVGQFGLSDYNVEIVLTVDGQDLTLSGVDSTENDVTQLFVPSIMLVQRDGIHTFESGAQAALYAWAISLGDSRGAFWRNSGVLTVRNISSAAILLYKSEFTTKLYTQ